MRIHLLKMYLVPFVSGKSENVLLNPVLALQCKYAQEEHFKCIFEWKRALFMPGLKSRSKPWHPNPDREEEESTSFKFCIYKIYILQLEMIQKQKNVVRHFRCWRNICFKPECVLMKTNPSRTISYNLFNRFEAALQRFPQNHSETRIWVATGWSYLLH